jgi:hypothetical protein
MTVRPPTPPALAAPAAALALLALLAAGCASSRPATPAPAIGAPPAAAPEAASPPSPAAPAAPPPAAATAPPEPEAPAQPEPAAPTAESATVWKNTLRWSTASEVDNFGYDVYRGEREEGPFVRLNETPVPGAGTTDLPARYVYVDDTIDPDRDYYYYVESISMGGEREIFTPTFKAPAKRQPSDAAAPGAEPPPAPNP